MIKIKRIANEESIHHYVFENSTNIHNELLGYFNDLKFEKDELIKIDTPFTELEEEYIFMKSEKMKIHFFICRKNIHMIIDSDESQKNIHFQMRNYFLFPR